MTEERPWIIYVRSREPGSMSEELQEKACLDLVPAGAPHQVIHASGSSYANHERELEALIQRGEFEGVIAYDYSRLSRNLRTLARLLATIYDRDLRLRIVSDPRSTSGLEAQRELTLAFKRWGELGERLAALAVERD